MVAQKCPEIRAHRMNSEHGIWFTSTRHKSPTPEWLRPSRNMREWLIKDNGPQHSNEIFTFYFALLISANLHATFPKGECKRASVVVVGVVVRRAIAYRWHDECRLDFNCERSTHFAYANWHFSAILPSILMAELSCHTVSHDLSAIGCPKICAN